MTEAYDGFEVQPPERLLMKRTTAVKPDSYRIDYAKELNDEQLAAVSAVDGQILILAGAGSGKTRVITYRVAYLVENGVRPSEILLTTFTNRAAKSMLQRVEHLLGADLRQMTGGTFHSICNRMLRRYASAIGFSQDFTILDEDDAVRLMKRARNESGVDTTERMFPAPKVLKRISSLLINSTIELDDVIIEEYPQFANKLFDFEKVFAGYTALKQLNDAMDYDDLLLWTVKLLSEHSEVREEVAGNLRHVLVDEYQDTNHLQAKLVDLWSSVHGNMFVVGDDAQSIYSFRGADYKNILTFPNRYPYCEIFKLETNYRSTPEILGFANEVFKSAPLNFRKTLRAVKPPSIKPSCVVCKDADDQADFIAERILEYREDGINLNDIGILYRAHRNSQEIEMALSHRGIPYFIRGGVRFMEMAHIKDLLSYMVLIGAPRNEIAWERVLSMCHGIGEKTIAVILAAIKQSANPIAMFQSPTIQQYARGVGRQSIASLQVFLSDLMRDNKKLEPVMLARAIYTLRYKTYLEAQYENARKRIEDIEQFMIFASRFSSLQDMLQEVSLHGGFLGVEVAAVDPVDVEDGRVCLSTIHQAKGLEWKNVFVVWLVDGSLPHVMSLNNHDSMEEERRLFYVAITRAKDELVMSYPQQTTRADFSIDFAKPSRYFGEIDRRMYDEFVLEWDSEPSKYGSRPKETSSQSRSSTIQPKSQQSQIDISKLGGKMVGGRDPSLPGGIWVPNIPGINNLSDDDEEEEGFEWLDE